MQSADTSVSLVEENEENLTATQPVSLDYLAETQVLFTVRKLLFLTFVLTITIGLLAGCNYSTTNTGLPLHVKTVSVQGFRNKTAYNGLERRLTRNIIERLNSEPSIRVVNRGGDAIISGEITSVQKTVLREDRSDHPQELRMSITVVVTLEDAVTGNLIFEKRPVSSEQGSSASGVFDKHRGGTEQSAEESALTLLASEIVRQVVVGDTW